MMSTTLHALDMTARTVQNRTNPTDHLAAPFEDTLRSGVWPVALQSLVDVPRCAAAGVHKDHQARMFDDLPDHRRLEFVV